MYACLYLPPRAVTTPPSSVDVTQALVSLARAHSPSVELHGQQLVMLDLHGTDRLWGSPREIGSMLRRKAADRQLPIRIAVAATRMAALLATQGRSGLTIIPPGAEAETLAPLSLSVLKQLAQIQAEDASHPNTGRRPRVRATRERGHPLSPTAQVVPVSVLVPIVQRWGLKTLGDLAALPAADLFGRLGAGGLELHRVARGEDTRPLVATPIEERFEQTFALEWPIDGLEPLSFVLGRVLEPLCTQLERRGAAVGSLHVRLTLVTHACHDRMLQLPAPLRDPRVLRTLILLDLETHPPSAGIDRVTVTADPVPARVLQGSLLERALPSAERVSTLLGRLSVLMGARRCGVPVVVDSHRPGAFEMRTFTLPADQPPAAASGSRVTEPLRLIPMLRRFRRPLAARVMVNEGRPVRVVTNASRSGTGRIIDSAGPWRTSGEWWDSAPAPSRAGKTEQSWDRDEWDVALSDGGVYRIFRDRVSDRWFLEGMLD